MKKSYFLPALAVVLGGCSFVDRYEEQVHGMEPIYCYQSLAGVECLKEPYRRDDLRLVNYFGPHPTRHEAPKPRKMKLFAPPPVGFWVKDPEPIPTPMKPMATLKTEARAASQTAKVFRIPTAVAVKASPENLLPEPEQQPPLYEDIE